MQVNVDVNKRKHYQAKRSERYLKTHNVPSSLQCFWCEIARRPWSSFNDLVWRCRCGMIVLPRRRVALDGKTKVRHLLTRINVPTWVMNMGSQPNQRQPIESVTLGTTYLANCLCDIGDVKPAHKHIACCEVSMDQPGLGECGHAARHLLQHSQFMRWGDNRVVVHIEPLHS